MKFKYGDEVEIVDGFYRGRKGVIKDYRYAQSWRTLWKRKYSYIVQMPDKAKGAEEQQGHGLSFLLNIPKDLYQFQEHELKKGENPIAVVRTTERGNQ